MNKAKLWKQLNTQIEANNMLEISLADSVLSESLAGEDGYYGSNDYINELEQIFLRSEIQWLGLSNDFHNLAVNLSRIDRNHLACIVLEKGLNEYPASVDLLADYLKYGAEDMQWEQCEKFYLALKLLDHNDWNWRAYSFSIDYLLEKRERIVSSSERKTIQNETLQLAKEFVKKERSDLAYFDLANVYNTFNNKRMAKTTLEVAVEKNGFSPRCSLRLADMDISAGNYHAALERLKVCETAFKPQLDFNLAYVYLLKVLCKSSLLLSKLLENKETSSPNQDDVYSIYRDYNSVMAIGIDGIMQKTIKAVVAVIENQTEIKNISRENDATEF